MRAFENASLLRLPVGSRDVPKDSALRPNPHGAKV